LIDAAAVVENAGPIGVAVLILYWQVEKIARRMDDLEWAVWNGNAPHPRYRRMKKR